MEKLKLPPHPTMNIKCFSCRHFLASETKKVAYDSSGGIHNMEDVIRNGLPTHGMVSGIISWCTFPPVWTMVNDDHWCGNYSSNISLKTTFNS